jgi:hypothetical protein
MIKSELGKTRTIKMTWDRLTEEECIELSEVFDSDEGTLTFADALLGKDTTMRVYTGDFTGDYLYSTQDDEYRYSCTLDFIEIDCLK